MTHTTPSNRQIVTPPNMSCPSILEFARLELLNHFSVPNLRQQKTHFADNFPISFQSYSLAIRFSKGFLEVDSFD